MKIYDSKEIAVASLGKEADYELSFPDSLKPTCFIVILVVRDGENLHTSAYRQRQIGFVEAGVWSDEKVNVLHEIREKKLNKDA